LIKSTAYTADEWFVLEEWMSELTK